VKETAVIFLDIVTFINPTTSNKDALRVVLDAGKFIYTVIPHAHAHTGLIGSILSNAMENEAVAYRLLS